MLPAYRRAFALLRLPFSLFLMPIFWFGLSALREPFGWGRAAAAFAILHLLVYPASNGYNSYYDKDEGSIGGLKAPPAVTPELLHLVWLFETLAVVASLLLGWPFLRRWWWCTSSFPGPTATRVFASKSTRC